MPNSRPAAVRRALVSDVALAARAGRALGGVTAAGGGTGAALAGLLGRADAAFPWLLLGLCCGVAGGLGLALWAVADRRHARRAGRARARLAAALALVGLLVPALGVGRSPYSIGAALALGVALAVAVAGLGALAARAAGGAVERAAAERRRAWRAQLRAARLTRRMLGLEAYRRLRRDGALPVQSTLYPHRTYLVPLRTTPSGARILVLEGGRAVGGLCVRPREPLPDPEEALTQILAIRANERAWLDRANFFPHDRQLTPQARGLLPGRPGNYDR
ncbi:MAG TPA: hypothetical protein VFW96_28405 [Thermomicrobiales bacterium]|nr:hypothetical protein [Thermomicrobiales bacterium]